MDGSSRGFQHIHRGKADLARCPSPAAMEPSTSAAMSPSLSRRGAVVGLMTVLGAWGGTVRSASSLTLEEVTPTVAPAADLTQRCVNELNGMYETCTSSSTVT